MEKYAPETVNFFTPAVKSIFRIVTSCDFWAFKDQPYHSKKILQMRRSFAMVSFASIKKSFLYSYNVK